MQIASNGTTTRTAYDVVVTIVGARYLATFVSSEAGAHLLRDVDTRPWLADLQRRVQHYGYRYDYKARRVARDMYLGPLPEFLLPIVERLTGEGLFATAPDQAIINEYEPGQGISAHVDCVPCFGETIATLSLGSECEMEFVRGDESERMILQVGSLLVLSGPARYEWTHAIRGRKSDHKRPRTRRVSVTFRTIVREPG